MTVDERQAHEDARPCGAPHLVGGKSCRYPAIGCTPREEEEGEQPVARFDSVADRYDAFCATPLGTLVDTVERQMVGALLDLHAGDWVVALGCATGALRCGWPSGDARW